MKGLGRTGGNIEFVFNGSVGLANVFIQRDLLLNQTIIEDFSVRLRVTS